MVIEGVTPNNVYGDESIQTDKEALRELYAVTAYVANLDSWIKAEQEWQAALAASNLSEFHTTNFLGPWGEFRNDWPDERRDALWSAYAASRLTQYPSRRRLCRYSSGLQCRLT